MQSEEKTIRQMRAETGMTRSEFAAFFEIPARTIQEWEQERKSPAPYIPKMIRRILDNEFFSKQGERK